MRQNDVPVSESRIQQGLAWLKREQRESGRWWMYSLYRGNYNYITYIATIEAMKTPWVRERLEGLGAQIVAEDEATPQFLGDYVKSEIEKWAGPIKASGVAVD